MKPLSRYVCLFVLSTAQLAWAAGADSPGAPGEDPALQRARELVTRKDWPAAAEALAAYTRTDPGNADGYNLLGYSYRHLKRYDESLAAYQRALAIDPKHRGAHEYIGEAYIQLGQLDKAREHLDALDKLCFFSCEEYRDLKKAYGEALRRQGR